MSNVNAITELLQQNPGVRSFLFGSLSSTCSTLAFQPFDLLKTRMQNNIQYTTGPHASIAVNRTSMIAIVSNVIKTESYGGLWRGTVPSLFRAVPGVGLYFVSLHHLRSLVTRGSSQPDATQAIVIGLGARTFSASILHPFAVIKTRSESGRFSYKSLWDAFKKTHSRHGVKGLYTGFSPTLLRDAPFSGLYYMFYTQMKLYIHGSDSKTGNPNSDRGIETLINFSSGIVAGIVASIITHPADVVKTRMQVDPKGFPRLGTSILIIFKERGLVGFFIGLTPRIMRRTFMAAFTWTIFEHCIKTLGLK